MASDTRLLIGLLLLAALFLPGCESQEDKYAPGLRNVSQCNNMDTEKERLNCFRYVSLQQNKPENCEHYSGKAADCYTKVAVAMKNQSVCDRLGNAEEKYLCVVSVAGDNAIDAFSDLLDGKNPQCTGACGENRRQCGMSCSMVANAGVQKCNDDYSFEALHDMAGVCVDEVQTAQQECLGKCDVSQKACLEKC